MLQVSDKEEAAEARVLHRGRHAAAGHGDGGAGGCGGRRGRRRRQPQHRRQPRRERGLCGPGDGHRVAGDGAAEEGTASDAAAVLWVGRPIERGRRRGEPRGPSAETGETRKKPETGERREKGALIPPSCPQ